MNGRAYWHTVVATAAILAVMASGAAADFNTDSLVAEWLFDEGSGSAAYDTSGNGHHGTINGAQWVPGVSGTGLQFDGSNDSVYVGTSLLGGPAFTDITVDAWFCCPVGSSIYNPYSAVFADETTDGEINIGIWNDGRAMGQIYTPVSYTHLTLPTN